MGKSKKPATGKTATPTAKKKKSLSKKRRQRLVRSAIIIFFALLLLIGFIAFFAPPKQVKGLGSVEQPTVVAIEHSMA